MAAPATPPHSLELGGELVTIQRPTGLKASRAFALMRELSRAMPDLQTRLATFRREYERENVVELDRVQARLEYPPRPLFEEALDADGRPVNRPVLDPDGRPVMRPSPVDRITEADWQAAGGVWRAPRSPSAYEVTAALFDQAVDVAEHHVYRLLALFTIPNADLKRARRDGTADELLATRVEELLDDAYADELVELAVVVGEAIDHHLIRKSRELGDRLGNVLRLAGIDLKSPPTSPTPTPSSSRPSSSTDTPPNTPDGPPTPSSTPPTTSSSSSPDSSTPTTANGSSPSSSATAAAP